MNIQGAFLVLTLVLAGWLGYQAVDAASSHRRAAEAALIDYAGIAAWEFSRTGEDDLDEVLNDVFNPVKRRMRGGGQPIAEVVGWNLHEAVRDEGCRCPGWREPLAVFGYDAVRGRTFSVPEGIPAANLRRLADTIFAEWPFASRSGEGMLTSHAGQFFDEAVAVGYTVAYDSTGAPRATYGFVVRADALAELLHEFYDDRQLLPQPLAGTEANDSILSISVRNPSGLTLFASPVSYPGGLSARDTLSADFGNLIVEATIRPDRASQLIIGGLPQARLPLLVVLLVLTLGVGLAAFVQLRREQRFQRLRDDFVSGVSHELRTPLAQIRMFAELQEAGKLRTEQDRSRATGVIHREAQRLSLLLENILQFSKLRRPASQGLPTEVLDLEEAIADGVEAVTPLVEHRGMKLDVIAEPGLRVEANRAALTRIVVNLLDNAVKYGPHGQTIRMRLARSQGSARLTVSDEGPGVPPADRERVWHAYRRLERDVNAQLPGTGIGLSVVSRLTSLHDGSSWIEEAASGGARFVVELPLAAVRPTPPRATVALGAE